jgi:hypothetical protein
LWRGSLETGRRDAFNRAGDFEFQVQPAKEGQKGDLRIANYLCCEGIGLPVEAFGLIIGAQPGQVTSVIFRSYFTNRSIADVFQPLVQKPFVIFDRAGLRPSATLNFVNPSMAFKIVKFCSPRFTRKSFFSEDFRTVDRYCKQKPEP